MFLLSLRHDPWLVTAAVLLAVFTAYVALDLSRRVRAPERAVALAWWAGGSVALGAGWWAAQVVGMLAAGLPLALGPGLLASIASGLAATAAAALALGIACARDLALPRLVAGALATALGFAAMRWLSFGMVVDHGALAVDGLLLLASWMLAGVAAAALLVTFARLRRASGRRRLRQQALAAAGLGIATVVMQHGGLLGLQLPASFVAGGAAAGGGLLAVGIVVSAFALLALTLFTSVLDARLEGRAAKLAQSLQLANERLQAANETLRRRAFLDPLTGLPNRLLFDDRLKHAMERHHRAAAGTGQVSRLGVLFVDLDGFRAVNESYGHAAGDAVLQQAAARLSAVARAQDTVARVGGDEFVLLLEDVIDGDDCAALARRLLEAFAVPFEIPPRRLTMSCSIGIVLHPDHGDAGRLVAHADAARNAARRAGGATFALYQSHMDEGALEQLSLQGDLRRALEANELRLHYQPKLDARSGAVRGVEALLRWQHPERGMVSPAVFVPIAERFGLINALGAWVIDEACRQMQAWAAQGLVVRVAVNLSMYQLRDAALVPHVAAALQRHGIAPQQLLCEVTESLAMDDLEATQRSFDGLAALGVFLAIDDFGTGHSSLSVLRQLPARQLKIDRSFVRDLETSDEAKMIVDAIVYLAHRLGLAVVAEGVETAGQRDALVAVGCDELQGYLFARPMPPDALPAWMAAQPAASAAALATA